MFAAKVVVLEPNLTKSVETDIGFCFLKKYVANIYSRSSLSLRSIHIGGGIIDPDFRGNIGVIMSNFSSNRLEVNVVDRISQVLFQKKKRTQILLRSLILMIFLQKEETRALDLLVFNFFLVLKKCQKIVVQEFDVCHVFVGEIRHYIFMNMKLLLLLQLFKKVTCFWHLYEQYKRL